MPATEVVSIGYEGRTADDVLAALAHAGVTVLADVRLTPRSRKAGLSKTRLGQAASERGIRYVHLPALGNPPEDRAPFRTGDVASGRRRLRERYAEPDAAAALDDLSRLVREERVALLCVELSHDACHRQVVVEELAERLAGQLTVVRL